MTLLACQKEIDFQDGGSNSTAIEGDYDYLGMTSNTISSMISGSGPLEEKAITTSTYSTENNTGTVKITATQFITTDVGYSVNTTAHSKMYIGGILINEFDFPFVATVPPTSATSNYQRISADSIYFPAGMSGSNPSGGGSLPMGSRLSWSGDTLLLKSVFSFTDTQDIGGVLTTITSGGDMVVKLKKR